jgi:hypothetical protein
MIYLVLNGLKKLHKIVDYWFCLIRYSLDVVIEVFLFLVLYI